MSYFNVFLVSLILSMVSACMPLGSGGSDDESEAKPNIESSSFDVNATLEGDFIIELGEELRLQVNTSQYDGGNLSFEASNIPDWISIDSENGLISGTPAQSDIGIYDNIRISISKDGATHTIGPYSIEVVDMLYGFNITWEPVTQNEDGVTIDNISSYKIEWKKTGTSITEHTYITGQQSNSGTVGRLKAGTYEVSVKSVIESMSGANLESAASSTQEITLGEA